jgi:hypothetical protein
VRNLAAPSKSGVHRPRCYVCRNVVNPTKPSKLAYMKSDAWPYEDFVLAHEECGTAAGLRTVRLSRSEPIPATLESFEGLEPFPVLPVQTFQPLGANVELDLPRYVFEVQCTRAGRAARTMTFDSYDDALVAYRETNVCGGHHDFNVRLDA